MRSKVDFRLPGNRIRRAAILIGSSAFAVAALASPDAAMAATAPAAAHASSTVTGAKAAAAQFSKKSAAAWALANVKTSNNGSPDDCADFVSRALQAGGYPFSYTPSVIVTNSTNDKYWYYFTTRYGRHYTHSWNVAHDLAVHLIDMKSKRVLNPKNAQPGDVIFANWKGSNFSGISHVGIVTGMSNGVPLITQHSPSQKNISLNYWLKHGGPDVHVWIYSPNP